VAVQCGWHGITQACRRGPIAAVAPGRLIPKAEAIRRSIETALRTPKGTRLFRPDLGYAALERDGKPKKGLTREFYKSSARDVLLTLEAEIDLQDVQVEMDAQGTLSRLSVQYRRKAHGQSDSVVIQY